MVRKMFKIDRGTVLALPQELLDVLHVQAGEDVAVELDAARRQIIITRIAAEPDGSHVDFARQVAEFIDNYRPALESLAKTNKTKP